ncbi:MAG: hypothetical protein ACR2PR_11185 [Pseudohongiellaceae bacterium]
MKQHNKDYDAAPGIVLRAAIALPFIMACALVYGLVISAGLYFGGIVMDSIAAVAMAVVAAVKPDMPIKSVRRNQRAKYEVGVKVGDSVSMGITVLCDHPYDFQTSRMDCFVSPVFLTAWETSPKIGEIYVSGCGVAAYLCFWDDPYRYYKELADWRRGDGGKLPAWLIRTGGERQKIGEWDMPWKITYGKPLRAIAKAYNAEIDKRAA